MTPPLNYQPQTHSGTEVVVINYSLLNAFREYIREWGYKHPFAYKRQRVKTRKYCKTVYPS